MNKNKVESERRINVLFYSHVSPLNCYEDDQRPSALVIFAVLRDDQEKKNDHVTNKPYSASLR